MGYAAAVIAVITIFELKALDCVEYKTQSPETLIKNKWPSVIDRGDHRFWRQKMAFNKTPFFGSEIVTF
jgi:hypothetical protein